MPRAKHSTIERTYSRYGREAVATLGQLIRINRIERKLSMIELAERVGISRDMLRRIENGDPRCEIGAAFEAAAIVGVSLFEEDRGRLATRMADQAEKLSLLPKKVRKPKTTAVRDDF